MILERETRTFIAAFDTIDESRNVLRATKVTDLTLPGDKRKKGANIHVSGLIEKEDF